jgi:serine/threonine protein kinase
MKRIPLLLSGHEVQSLADRSKSPANMIEFYQWLDNIEYTHTDIKPDNIRKAYDGTVKLIDLESFE